MKHAARISTRPSSSARARPRAHRERLRPAIQLADPSHVSKVGDRRAGLDATQPKVYGRLMRRVLAVVASSWLVCALGLSAPVVSAEPLGCTIRGTNGPDRLNGTSGSDVICGFRGEDVLRGGGGADVLYGGDGSDELQGAAGSDVMYGGDEADLFQGGGDADAMYGGPMNDAFYPGKGADAVYGGGGGDFSESSPGDDRLYGGAGNDFLFDNQGVDLLRGGDGNERCLGAPGGGLPDTIIGGSGFDDWLADSQDILIGVERESPTRCD
jgi:hypothetical protein